MKQWILIGLMLLASGCNAGDSTDKTIAQLQHEIKQKQDAIELIKASGGYKRVVPDGTVCINGVVYYQFQGAQYTDSFTPAVSNNLTFISCSTP